MTKNTKKYLIIAVSLLLLNLFLFIVFLGRSVPNLNIDDSVNDTEQVTEKETQERTEEKISPSENQTEYHHEEVNGFEGLSDDDIEDAYEDSAYEDDSPSFFDVSSDDEDEYALPEIH